MLVYWEDFRTIERNILKLLMEDAYIYYVSIRVIHFGNILEAHFDPLQQFLLIHDQMTDMTQIETEWKNTASSMGAGCSCNTQVDA